MKSFWQHESLAAVPALAGRHETDIAIVGGGYTGSWLAYWLKDSGLKVTVLESQRPGYGASGRNGGLLLQGPAQLLGEAASLLGQDAALEFLHWTRRTFEWVSALSNRHALDWHKTGSLYVGGDMDERPTLEETVRLMQESGIRALLVPHQEQPPSIQRLGYDLGAWFPDDGMIHPIRLIGALLTEARDHGVEIYQDTPVSEYEDSAQGVLLHGPNFTVRADRMVIATNAYSSEWVPWLEPLVEPVRGQMLASAPVIPLDHAYPVYADHGYNYWHQRADGRILMGGFRHLAAAEETGTDLSLHTAIQNRLTRLLFDLAGHPVPIADRWAGIMAMTPDHRPYIGSLTDRVWTALGYNGHGSTVAPVAARMVRDGLIDGTPVFAPYDVRRAIRPAER